MNRPLTILGAGLLFFACCAHAHAHRPSEDAPADVYTVTISASWEGLGEIGATVADVTITTPTSIYERRVLVGPVFTVEALDGPPYGWRIDGLWHLPTEGTSATAEIEAGVQRVGDAPRYAGGDWEQGDGVVDVLDFSALKTWYGYEQQCCDPGIFEQACVNFDGTGLVEVSDFNLFAPNFGVSGP